jgi:hypothetical protein
MRQLDRFLLSNQIGNLYPQRSDILTLLSFGATFIITIVPSEELGRK